MIENIAVATSSLGGSFANLVTGTLGRQMDFGFGFLVTENRELSFFERYPATSGYYVIPEKNDFWWPLVITEGILREFQNMTSGLKIFINFRFENLVTPWLCLIWKIINYDLRWQFCGFFVHNFSSIKFCIIQFNLNRLNS